MEFYLPNCFLLIIPIIIWNIIFAPKLTQTVFSSDEGISKWILTSEHFFRLPVFLFPILMPIQISDLQHIAGIFIYGAGTLVYFTSWLPLIYRKDSKWANSSTGILTPFGTPLIIFTGIALTGDSWIYFAMAVLFTVIHLLHGIMSLKIQRRHHN